MNRPEDYIDLMEELEIYFSWEEIDKMSRAELIKNYNQYFISDPNLFIKAGDF